MSNAHTLPQTATNRTTSPSLSDDDGRHDPDTGLDRQHLDREQARRRFERSSVHAKDIDYSDSLASNHRSYKTKSRRRRIKENGVEELGDLSDSEDETLTRKLARLRREAEEIKLELEKRQEEPTNKGKTEDDEATEDSVVKLSEMLDGLHTTSKATNGTRETFSHRIAAEPPRPATSERTNAVQKEPTPIEASVSTNSAIASFSDRLTALESTLGLASTPTNTESASILPVLTSLSTQITTLSTNLISSSSSTYTPSDASITSSTQNQSTLPHLDALASRLRTLTAESDKLNVSRKRALDSLHELQEARMRDPIKYARERKAEDPAAANEIARSVFEDSSAKITALYATLPTIKDLQPLLPVVLERLRSLQSIHAGAATAKEDLDEVERRQAETSREIARWTNGLADVEAKMKEYEKVMGENKEVVGNMVGAVETRLAKLEP